ncbi:MAG: FUSC family protein, partial [Chloroflexota bacterium]
ALAAIAFLAGCGLAVGPVVARMTNVMALWFLTAVALLTGETEFSRPALGFLAGSVAVFALLELWKRVQGIRLEPLPPLADRMRQGLAWGSPVLRYAVVSAAAGAAALWLGWEVLPDNRVWAAATALVLVRPAARESLAMTVQRLAGTALGAWLAVSVIGRIEDPRLLLPLALLATFLMAATLKVDYAIFATFLTAQVVALAALAGEDPLRTSQDRVLATLLGAGIALAATLVLRLGAPPGDGEDAPG